MIERAYRSVPGVADDSGFGGTTMQYQVLLDPARIYGYHLTVPAVMNALGANNSNAGGGFYSQGGQFYYVRGIGLVRNTSDIGNIVVGSSNGVPIRVKDIGDVVIGHAPRLGEFGYQKNDDAVEGVILMLRGEQTQNVLKGVEAKTEELNRSVLPPDVKIHPYYDRSELVKLTTDTVEDNLLRGMVLVLIVLIFFLVSFRAAVIVALTIPLSLLFAFIVLHAHDGAANLLSIGAIDFGIIIDGTVVMVENIYRELALREGQTYKLNEVILAAAKDVDRPIFYSVAVILAGYLPIYALSGPSAKLFHPMAETMSFALVGALILTLTLVPVLASYWFKKRRTRAHQPPLRMDEAQVRDPTGLGSGAAQTHHVDRAAYLRRNPAAGSLHRRRVHASSRRGRTLGAGHHAVHDLVRRGEQNRSADSRHSDVVSASHRGRLGVGTSGRWNRPHRLFQLRVLCRSEALQGQGLERRHQYQAQTDRVDQPEAERVPRNRLQLHPARGRCRGRGADRA